MAENLINNIPRWIILPFSLLLIILGLRQMGIGIEEVMGTDNDSTKADIYEMPIAERSAYTMIDNQGFDPAQAMATVKLPNDWKRQSDTSWRGSEACGYTSLTHLMASSDGNRAKIEITDSIARFVWKSDSQKPNMTSDPCLGVSHLQNKIVKTVEQFIITHFIPKFRGGYQLEEIVDEPDVIVTTPGAKDTSRNTRIKIARVFLSKVTEKRVILETVFVNLRLTPFTVEGEGDYTLGQVIVFSLAASEDYFYLIEPLLNEVILSYLPNAEYQALVGATGFVPKQINSPSET